MIRLLLRTYSCHDNGETCEKFGPWFKTFDIENERLESLLLQMNLPGCGSGEVFGAEVIQDKA